MTGCYQAFREKQVTNSLQTFPENWKGWYISLHEHTRDRFVKNILWGIGSQFLRGQEQGCLLKLYIGVVWVVAESWRQNNVYS